MSRVLTPYLCWQAIRKNAFVHARLTIGDLIALFQILANIVRIEKRHPARLFETVPAERDNISVGADQDTEIAEEGTHPADRLRTILKQLEPVILLDDPRHGQIFR